MKHNYFFAAIAILLSACEEQQEEFETICFSDTPPEQEQITLGRKLENPYSVENMRKAYSQLKGNLKSTTVEDLIKTTHYYVKFKPKDDEDVIKLQNDTTIEYYCYPLDYELSEGEYYHDPELSEDVPTYRYASIPVEHEFPDVENEILENLFIPYTDSDSEEESDDSSLKNAQLIIDNSLWESLEDISLRMTGNESEMETDGGLKASKWRPKGRITYYDNTTNKMIPIEGVKVRARRFFTTHKGFTDANGYYTCDGRFRYKANYSIKWERADFEIRPNTGLSTAEYDGPKRKADWNVELSSGNQWYYASIFRACHYYYYKDISSLTCPPENGFFKAQLKIRASNKTPDSNGTFTSFNFMGLNSVIHIYSSKRTSMEIYATTIHELSHAAHWKKDKTTYKNTDTKVKESWARGVQWWLTKKIYPSYRGGDTYLPYYTQVVVDLIDKDGEDKDNNGKTNDGVSGYTIKQIEDALKGATTFNKWRDNIINKYNNETENKVTALFDSWD